MRDHAGTVDDGATARVTSERPLPVADDVSGPFWAAAAEGRLVVQRCERCDRFQHPPRAFCVTCGDPSPEFREVSGGGELVSWTVTHHKVLPSLSARLPYVCLLVGLTEQPDLWMVSDLIGEDTPVESLRVGMEMTAHFDLHVDDKVLPRFLPAPAQGGR